MRIRLFKYDAVKGEKSLTSKYGLVRKFPDILHWKSIIYWLYNFLYFQNILTIGGEMVIWITLPQR